MLGMIVEERLAFGYVMFRVYSATSGVEIARALRDSGHAVTDFVAHGRMGGSRSSTRLSSERKRRPCERSLMVLIHKRSSPWTMCGGCDAGTLDECNRHDLHRDSRDSSLPPGQMRMPWMATTRLSALGTTAFSSDRL